MYCNVTPQFVSLLDSLARLIVGFMVDISAVTGVYQPRFPPVSWQQTDLAKQRTPFWAGLSTGSTGSL